MVSNDFKNLRWIFRSAPKDQGSHLRQSSDSIQSGGVSYKKSPLFQVGRRKLYLPNFTITFLRTPTVSPHYAHFHVPLWFNKFDLRDYLLHAYFVRTLNVRSFIIQQAIQSVTRGSWRDIPGKRKLYRPKAIKKMIVELEQPFVWPDPPQQMDDWEPERYKRTQEEGWREQTGDPGGKVREKSSNVKQLAERLLNGTERWKGINPTFVGVGGGSSMELPLR